MNICNHIIDDNEIIGIGPLMTAWPTSGIDQLYGRKKHYFLLHTAQQSIKIESDFLETANLPDDSLKKNKKILDDFIIGYDKAKEQIASWIGTAAR